MPVVTVVVPILNALVSLLIQAGKAFASFMANLFGLGDSWKDIIGDFDISGGGADFGDLEDALDSADDSSSGVSDNLGKASKSAKEIKKQLAGIDEINNLTTPTDTSNTGTGGTSGGGAGSSYIPSLEWDNLWKSADPDPYINEWVEKIKRALNTIFDPIKNSWDKYGNPIMKNFKEAYENIKIVVGGITDVLSEKWEPFFQASSDLFFSLLETASLVFEAVTEFFRTVWNSGGDKFLGGVMDLTTAFLNLAIAVNDKFGKPLLSLFKNTIGKTVATIIGTILGLLGNALTLLSNLVTWISSNDIALSLLVSTLTAFFGVIAIGKLSELWNSFSAGTTILDKVVTLFAENTRIGATLWESYVNGESKFKALKDAWNTGLGVVSGLFEKLSSGVGTLGNFIAKTDLATTSTDELNGAQKLVKGATEGLQNVFGFFASNPLAAVIAGISALTIGFGLFLSSQANAKLKIEDCSEEIQEQYYAIKNLNDEVDENIKKIDEQDYSLEAQIGLFRNYKQELEGLSDENGYVKNIDDAKYLVEEMNKILPDTVEITDDGRVAWKKTNEEIEKNIEALKKQAKQQAYQQAYVKSIEAQLQAEQALNKAQEEKEKLLKEQKQAYDELKNSSAGTNLTFEEYQKMQTPINQKIKEQDALIEGLNEEYETSSENVEYLDGKLSSLFSTTGDVTDATKKEEKQVKTSYKNMKKEAKTQIDGLISSLKDYDKKMDGTGENGEKLTDEEVKNLEERRKQTVNKLGEISRQYGLSYDEIIKQAESNGLKLTKQEKETLKEITESYGESGKTSGTNFAEGVANKLSSSASNILETAKGVANGTTEGLKSNPINYSTDVNSIDEKTKVVKNAGQAIASIAMNFATAVNEVSEIVKTRANEGKAIAKQNTINFPTSLSEVTKSKVKSIANSASKVAKVTLSAVIGTDMTKAGKTAGNNFKDGFSKIKINAKGTGVFSSILNAVGTLGNALSFYASGGFPSVGEMFIARENGIPELVGTMGGRNAVANNMQIENGIYRAVLQALREFGTMIANMLNKFLDILFKGISSIQIQPIDMKDISDYQIDYEKMISFIDNYRGNDVVIQNTQPALQSNRDGYVGDEIIKYSQQANQGLNDNQQDNGGDNVIDLNVYLSGKQIYHEVVREDKRTRRSTGKSQLGYNY